VDWGGSSYVDQNRLTMTVIESVEIRVLHLPCTVPYKSALGTINCLETLFAQVWLADGGHGFGEAVVISGYTAESHADSWRFLQQCAPMLVSRKQADASQILEPQVDEWSHAVTCLCSAIEMAAGLDVLAPVPDERSVDLLAPLYSEEVPALEAEIEARLEQGYRTLKLKVGLDFEADLNRVRAAQCRLEGRAVLRLDANQGYSRSDALRFAERLEPAGIELFEQPCAKGDWNAAAAVRAALHVPMMLDESITDIASIDRAADLRASSLIKLKLVKTGGVARLAETIDHAKRRGLDVILGNGVATEIGNWMEACVYIGRSDRAGEMNGFLKPELRLLAEPLEVVAGTLRLPPGYRASLDSEALDSCTLASFRY
jgi:L-alanine-DL-glutamate epimerase-like enolase superfamily enzyme